MYMYMYLYIYISIGFYVQFETNADGFEIAAKTYNSVLIWNGDGSALKDVRQFGSSPGFWSIGVRTSLCGACSTLLACSPTVSVSVCAQQLTTPPPTTILYSMGVLADQCDPEGLQGISLKHLMIRLSTGFHNWGWAKATTPCLSCWMVHGRWTTWECGWSRWESRS